MARNGGIREIHPRAFRCSWRPAFITRCSPTREAAALRGDDLPARLSQLLRRAVVTHRARI